jgi:hypothetical protein
MDEEGTSGQGFATTKPKKRLTQLEISVDEEPVSVPKMGPTKEKRPTMTPGQNVRRQTAPPQLGMLTSGFSINNYGSGTVANSDLGNIKDSIISNVGNNNSTNHFQRRPKKTRTGYGY